MTNAEIIFTEAVAHGIYTKEEAIAILESGNMIPLHTYQTWKSAGYQVKRGEHAKIETRLWKYKNKKKPEAESDADGESDGRYYMAKSFLFGIDQVEKIRA